MNDTVLSEDTNIIKNKAFSYTMDSDKIIRCFYFNEKYSIGAYEMFFAENVNGYCYGLGNDYKNGRHRYFHGGDHLGILAGSLYYFEEDLCIIILANNDFSNQYKLGDGISDIIFSQEPEVISKPLEVEICEELSHKYEGIYLEEKLELRRNIGGWELVRFKGSQHITLIPVGESQFTAKSKQQLKSYAIAEDDDGVPKLWGLRKR